MVLQEFQTTETAAANGWEGSHRVLKNKGRYHSRVVFIIAKEFKSHEVFSQFGHFQCTQTLWPHKRSSPWYIVNGVLIVEASKPCATSLFLLYSKKYGVVSIVDGVLSLVNDFISRGIVSKNANFGTIQQSTHDGLRTRTFRRRPIF